MKRGKGPRRDTLRARLTRSITLLCVAVLSAACGAIYFGVRGALRANVDAALASIAQTEVAASVDAAHRHLHVPPQTEGFLGLLTGAGYEKFAQLETPGGQVLARTPNLEILPAVRADSGLRQRALQGEAALSDLRIGSTPCRAIYYPVRDGRGRRLVAIVAVPWQPVRRSLEVLAAVLLLTLFVGAAVTAWAARRLSGRVTLPLEQIAGAARRVGSENLHERIPDVASDAEARAVTGVLNDMLDRLETAFAARERALAAQRTFVADASHELRSPLANLRGTVEVALRRKRPVEEYRTTLAEALGEIERLCRLTDGLLTLSHVESERFRLLLVPCDAVDIVRSALAAFGVRAEQAGVRLALEGECRAAVMADRDRLREVLDNLLDNALRHAPAGSTVTVAAHRDGNRVRLSVRDEGAGLTLTDQARIFDRFYRADRSRARRSGGAGLGLAIARAIVEAHRGSIAVESVPGEGAVFSVWIPMAPPEGFSGELPSA